MGTLQPLQRNALLAARILNALQEGRHHHAFNRAAATNASKSSPLDYIHQPTPKQSQKPSFQTDISGLQVLRRNFIFSKWLQTPSQARPRSTCPAASHPATASSRR